ncbi:MAG: hypothetical protein ACREMK_07110 [Gemmatimonadota bacterium]
MKHVMLGFAIVAVWATAASAQEPLLVSRGTVEVGDQLRATYLSNADREVTLTGVYAGLGPNALLLSTRPGGEQVHEVDLDEILRLERSRRRTVGEGAGRGAMFGALAGAIFGLAVVAACASDDGSFQCGGSDFLVGPAIFGGMGAGTGAVIGMAARGTTWEEVRLPEPR